MNTSSESHRESESATTHPHDGAEGSRSKRLLKLGIFLGIAMMLTGFWIANGRASKNRQQPSAQTSAAVIEVGHATQGEIRVYIDALGTVTPEATVNIYTQISGKVLSVHYREGQMVGKGAPLIDIDPQPYQAQLQQAEGTLERDKSLLTQAEMDLARYREAFAGHGISRQTLDDQEQAVTQYRGTVKYDQGQVQYARVQLSYCHITAPISGRIGLRLVDPGNTVFSGSSNILAVITQLQPVTVVFDVPEDRLTQLRSEISHRNRLKVDVFDRSLQTKLATGELLTLDNLIDTATGTIRFRAQFDNSDLSLFPNQFVNTRVLIQTLHNATLVPNNSVQHNGTQAYIYVVDHGSVKSQNVSILAAEGDFSAVEGIAVGTTVATSGFERLQDGTQISILKEEASSSSSAPQQSHGESR